MEILQNITDIRATANEGVLACFCTVQVGNVVEENVRHVYSANDPYIGEFGLSVKQWLLDNEGTYSVTPYVEPVYSIDEQRAMMPRLTSRQFWMAAANIDVDKDLLVTTIKTAMPDSIDRKMKIAELEASTFERLNPTVIDLMELMGIPADQVDALWIWAASL